MAQAVPFSGFPAPGLSGIPLPAAMAQPTGQFFTIFPPPEVFGEAVGEQLPTGPEEQGKSRTQKRQKTASRLPPELPPRANDVDPVAPRPVVSWSYSPRVKQGTAGAGLGGVGKMLLGIPSSIRHRRHRRERDHPQPGARPGLQGEEGGSIRGAARSRQKEIFAERALFLRDGIERSAASSRSDGRGTTSFQRRSSRRYHRHRVCADSSARPTTGRGQPRQQERQGEW